MSWIAPFYRAANAAKHLYWRLARPNVHGAKLLIFDAGGQLLLIRHSYGRSDLFMLPGGGIKRGETPVAAAHREAGEEVGCTVRDVRPLGVFLDTSRGARNHVHVFTARTDDSPRADGREIVEAGFFALDALPESTSDATLRRIDDWRAGRRDGSW